MNDLNKEIFTGLLCDNYTTVPNIEPTAAVSPIASAPQKVTRKAPLIRPDPPV
jgi:hypothetical protein